MCCSPFDKLRANGAGVAIVQDFPFVLSLSEHVSDHAPVPSEICYAPPSAPFFEGTRRQAEVPNVSVVPLYGTAFASNSEHYRKDECSIPPEKQRKDKAR